MPNLPLCDWLSQLFNLRAPSSTDVPVLLLNQPVIFAKTRSRMKTAVTFLHQFTRERALLSLRKSRSPKSLQTFTLTRTQEIMYLPFSTIRFPVPVLCPSIVTTPLVGICYASCDLYLPPLSPSQVSTPPCL